jgi:NDP-sugar pyrophosphorylase family protein
VLLDHFPTLEKLPLFCSYRDWFKAVLAWMPYAARLNRVGLREIQPGVWCGLRSRVAASALLRAPCWLGNHVQVSADAVIGPNAILEDRVVVESASEVISSFVGSDTFVGALTRVEDSIAMGSTLIDWKSGSCTQVPDPFLLCALGKQSGDGRELGGRLGSWLGLFKRPMGVVSGWQERLRSK